MTDRDVLIEQVRESADITKNKATEVVRGIFETIQNETVTNGSFGIVGFGTFKVVDRAERDGRNPQTGEAIKIPATKSVNFKVGKGFKEQVRK